MIFVNQPRARFFLFLLLAMLVSTGCFGQTFSNPYDRQFQELEGRWSSADAPTKAVLLDRMHGLREFVTDPARVIRKLTAYAEDWSEPTLVRDEANWHRAQIALHERRLDEARKLSDALGFVRDWTRTSSSNCFPIKPLPNLVLKSSPIGILTLHNTQATCIATAVYSAEAREVAIRFGSTGAVSLYVNGNLVKSDDELTAFAFDQRSVGVKLRPGWNIFALELDASTSSRQFALRVTAPLGGGISLNADSSRINTSTARTVVFQVTDLLEMAEGNTGSAAALDTMAALSRIRGMEDEFERLESIANHYPSAERWLALAKACGQQSCTFSSLNRALARDSKYVPAIVELASYYFNRRQILKSRDLLLDAIQLEPGNYVVRTRLAEAQAAAGFEAASRAEYQKLEATHSPAIWLKRELGLHYESTGRFGQAAALLYKAWKFSFDDSATRGALQRLAEKRGDSDVLLMLAQAAETLDPMSPVTRDEIAKFTSNSIGSSADSHPDLQSRPAAFIKGVPASARPAATHQLPKTPEHTEADALYLVNASTVAADYRRSAARDNSNVVTLADITVERVHTNGQSVIRTQQVFYMANDRGARDYTIRNVQYSHATQKLSVLRARLYKQDGRVFEAEDQGETSVADTSISMYYDTRSRAFRFPNLEKGDTIELDYRLTPSSNVNPYGDYFGTLIAFQNGLPQKLRRYVLVVPDSRKLNIVEERMPVKAIVSRSADQVTYQWDIRNIAPLASEPRGPSLTEVAPYVTVSTFQDWNQLGRWYAELITPQFSLDAELREVLARITSASKSEAEKIHEIHKFVLRNTHYVAMEFGIYSYKPYPVTQVYARRFGDCKDKASLMIALMRAVGVDAEIALVRTRKLGDVNERATALSVFNHAVVYVPKYDLWLDGTAEYAGSRGELPLDDQGAMALTVNLNGNATLRRIPITLPMQNYTHRVVRAQIQTDGHILFNGSAYTRGEDAPGLRREFEIADRQRDSVRANLAQVYPSVQVDSVQVDGAQDIERDINVKFSGSLNKFAGQRQLKLTSSWLPHQYVNSLANLSSRVQQLQLPAPWTTEEEIHFAIPESANVSYLPANVKHDTPFGTAVIRYERRERELIVTTSVQFRKMRIEPSEYPAFRQFCADVEKAFRQEITLQLGG